MSEAKAHIIDDDDDARDSLAFLLSTADIPAEVYPSARAFLEVAPSARGVVVTDIRMPEIDGMELVRRLKDLGVALPVIVMTGHGDVSLAVQAMKAGVSDFIEKPYNDETMIAAITAGLARGGEQHARDQERSEVLNKITVLSPRERDVLQGLVAGKANKVIAYDLGISPRTVEIYRAHLMTKMCARSLSELVRMALVAGVTS